MNTYPVEIINQMSFRAKTAEVDAELRRAHAGQTVISIAGHFCGGKVDCKVDMAEMSVHEPQARTQVHYPTCDGFIPLMDTGSYSEPLPEGVSVVAFALFRTKPLRN